MPDPTPAPAAPAEKIDPMVANIMKSFENVVTPSAETPIQPVSELAGITLGEAVMLANAKKSAPAQPASKVEAEEKSPPPATPAAPAEAPAATPTTKPVVTKKKPLPEPVPVAAPVIAQAPAPVAVPGMSPEDKTYVESLTPEQRDEVELAQFAETHGHPGKLSATLKYFRDLDKLIASNGDLTPESEEFTKFTSENSPKWNASARKRLEREMILEQATNKVRQEFQPEIEEQKRKTREIQLKSTTEEHVESLVAKMASPEIGSDKVAPIDPEIIDYIRDHGYEAASKKFMVEAPIVMGTINAERVWLGFSQGVLNFDPNDRTHIWLIEFLESEGARMKQMPEKERKQDGKDFLPIREYAAEFARDPNNASAKFYTFNDGMVRDLLASNAVLSVNQQIAKLEEGGFKYERKSKKVPMADNPPAEAPAPSGSPGVGFRSMPGASEIASPQADPRASYFEKLIPGGAKIAGVS